MSSTKNKKSRNDMTPDELYKDDLAEVNKAGNKVKRFKADGNGYLPEAIKAFDEIFTTFKTTWAEKYNAEYDPSARRKKITKLDCPYEEITRLYNNVASRMAKEMKKHTEKKQEQVFDEANGIYKHHRTDTTGLTPFQIDKLPDEHGISPQDERKFKKCFTSYYFTFNVDRAYIKRMTGLSLNQMYILQERFRNVERKHPEHPNDPTASRFGFIPYPEIKQAEAKADEKLRYETGNYY